MQLLPRGAVCPIAISIWLGGTSAVAQTRSAPVLVRAVTSGDTVDIAGAGRVRLAGIRSPKSGRWTGSSEPYADDARRRLTALVVNRWVRLERVGSAAGGTRTAYLWTEDGVMVNAVMLRDGLARLAPTPRSSSHLEELTAAEADARAQKRGLWSGGTGTAQQPDFISRSRPPRAPRTRRAR